MRTYDFAKYKLIIGGVPIVGYVDGTGINFDRIEDLFTEVVGADGSESRSKSNNRMALLTISLKNTSPSNDYLSILHTLDEANNQGIRSMILQDFNGTTVITSSGVYVKKFPTLDRAKEITNNDWVLACSRTVVFVGSNPDL